MASIAAGGYFVVAQQAGAFQAQFGLAPGAVYSGKLSSQGERICLLDSTSTLVDEVDYGVGFPWPTATKGQGSSMELIHPSLDNSLGGSWRASGTAAAAALRRLLVQRAAPSAVLAALATASTHPVPLGMLLSEVRRQAAW